MHLFRFIVSLPRRSIPPGKSSFVCSLLSRVQVRAWYPAGANNICWRNSQIGISLHCAITMISCTKTIPHQIINSLQESLEQMSTLIHCLRWQSPYPKPRAGNRVEVGPHPSGSLPCLSPSQAGNTRQPRLSRLLLLCYKYIMYIQNVTLKYYSMLQKRY